MDGRKDVLSEIIGTKSGHGESLSVGVLDGS